MERLFRKVFQSFGFDISRSRQGTASIRDVSVDDQAILSQIKPFTRTSFERQLALIQAVRYIVRAGIPGAFVECGVWRGGSSMAAALTFIQEGDTSRDLYLFDTFEGMTPPTDVDRAVDGILAKTQMERDKKGTGIWACASIEDVRANMALTKYPEDRVHFLKGAVEQTIPEHSPSAPLALLRLDTDWYESTKHEMVHLFPMLSQGGILIIDDYGHWQGARKAIDEYMTEQQKEYYMHRIDYTGRILVK